MVELAASLIVNFWLVRPSEIADEPNFKGELKFVGSSYSIISTLAAALYPRFTLLKNLCEAALILLLAAIFVELFPCVGEFYWTVTFSFLVLLSDVKSSRSFSKLDYRLNFKFRS